ncbi:MAG TPA: DUF1569 domain-containing protein [Tepidisphaeraceae bacterium]
MSQDLIQSRRVRYSSFMSTKRRSLDLRTLAQLREEVASLQTRGYDKMGKWSLGEMAEHLALTMEKSIDGFDIHRPLLFKMLGPAVKWAVLKYRFIPSGVPAPAVFLPAQLHSSGDAPSLERFRKTLDRYESFTGVLHSSPVFGTLTRAQWDQIHLIHAAHHLRYLQPR